jgi:L-lactate dehydrogenase complex protein LldG
MDRETFLARVRAAARIGGAYRVQVNTVPDNAGYCGGGEDLAATLAAEANAIGGEALVVADRQAARAAVAEILDRYSPTSALCWQHTVLDELDLDGILSSRGIERLEYATLHDRGTDACRAAMLRADIGISSATVAVAETGTIALASGPGTERVVSLLPPVHLAVVAASQILPDLFDLFAMLEGTIPDMPSNWVLITGPSKTGDLELKLTTGVHGPGHWHVLVVRDL